MSTDPKTSPPANQTWLNLAEQAAREEDGEKLRQLVEQICDSIDANAAKRKRPNP